MRSRKPLIETGGMEFVLAGLASKAGETMVSSVDHAIADRALLHPFEFLVKVALPYHYCLS